MQVEVDIVGFVLLRLGLAKVGMLAEVVVIELLLESLVGAFRHNALLFKDRENAHRLLDQINARLQVQAEVHHLPVDALFLVLLLFQDEHVVVKELLEPLIGEVNTELFKSVIFEYFKAGNVQNADEVLTLGFGVQCLVYSLDQPAERATVYGLAECTDGVDHLVAVLAFIDVLVADFDARLEQALQEVGRLNTEQMRDFFAFFCAIGLGLVLSGTLLPLAVAEVKDGARGFEQVEFLFLGEVKSVESLVGELHLLAVINVVDRYLTLGNVKVFARILLDKKLLC